MRNHWTLTAITGCIAALLAAPSIGQEIPRKDPKPFRGPLKPDMPLAKGYNDAAKALAMADDNPLFRWEYRVWCETGYRSLEDAGTGQEIDRPLDMTRDHISPKGFHPTGTPEGSRPMPAGARRRDDVCGVPMLRCGVTVL